MRGRMQKAPVFVLLYVSCFFLPSPVVDGDGIHLLERTRRRARYPKGGGDGERFYSPRKVYMDAFHWGYEDYRCLLGME